MLIFSTYEHGATFPPPQPRRVCARYDTILNDKIARGVNLIANSNLIVIWGHRVDLQNCQLAASALCVVWCIRER